MQKQQRKHQVPTFIDQFTTDHTYNNDDNYNNNNNNNNNDNDNNTKGYRERESKAAKRVRLCLPAQVNK